ncbi:MAG: DMT family transporter, partial [Actinomycetia bacterium]|nr:DMT family transporter [Actinomycetes bacterium]
MTPSGRHARANALLLVAALFWGMAFPAQRVAAANMGAFSYTSIRFAMGALLLAGVIAVLDRRRGLLPAQKRAATRAVVLPGVGVGLLLTLAVNLQQVGLVTTTASNAAFITGLYLIWVPILGVFGGKRLRWPIAVAVVLAVAGLYLIAVTGRFTLRPGDALMLAAGLAFAVEILVIDRFAPRLDLIRFACAQFASCAAFSGAFALWRDAAPFGGIGHTLWPLAYGGFVSVGIAYTLQTIAQR